MRILNACNASAWTGPTGNNTYFLPGRVPALVDAGVGHPDHLEALAAALGTAPLRLLLVTHGHPDHVRGVPAIVERWPGVRVLSAEGLAGSDSIEAGDAPLRIVPTPGHSPDHLCFLSETTGDLFCGDLVRRGGTIVIPASKGGNLRQYLASLEAVRKLRPARLLPGHGPVVDDPAALIDEYIRHRLEREAQIVAALREGDRTAAAIAARIYGSRPAAFAEAAADSVLAHLVKLEEDGRVGRAAEGPAAAGMEWILADAPPR